MTSSRRATSRTWRNVVVGAAAGVLTLVVATTTGPSAAVQAVAEGDADAGAEVYRANCAMCHGADAAGMMGMHPALRGAVDRLTVEGVEVTVRNGRATMPPMPAFGSRLSDEEIADVIAYIDALPDGPRNFGPGHEDGMGGGMMDGMMDDMFDGGSGWMVALVVVLAAALAGMIGYLLGSRRAGRRPRGPEEVS
ncbi:MAG: cytochrome c [Actinobacteria bacterium]|nr:cytochrome c [Actinomycetota bacterium]